ncbi:MAG: insulinase family protein [Flavobacteriales bacterium]|nr:insulinase family protein [Flavobacteriales bacterium]
MKLRHVLPLLLLLLSAASLSAQKKYTYTSVPGDPMETRIYTLDNGLQVWLSRNTDAPRVQTNIAVRAGSKNDPSDATGLAHYLEHMLFKGTSHIGTRDWAKESVLLKQISDAYEERRSVTDEAKRTAIYQRIDSLSQLAAALAVPNEYDKMIKSIGARGTNAYTSTERTVYINDVPSDELEKWMMVESERMHECVLRLFHTELETVYEEFNRGQDNDGRNAWQAMNKALYKHHPYGTQTTIGTGEHLKNPSMVKIHQYFDSWYVPNNMAVVLAGDIDYDKTIAMVDKYFGPWTTKTVPGFSFEPETPTTAPETVEVFGPNSEFMMMAWRFGGDATSDPIMLDLIAGIMSNGQAGLIDLDLLQDQKVLDAGASADAQADYSEFSLSGEAREGQTLEQVRDLLLAEMEKVKQGAFDDWLIDAVVNDNRQTRLKFYNENNSMRASAMTNAFILKQNWQDQVDYYDRMAKITKQQVMDFASKRFGSDYVCVFKRTGENKDAFKVNKPKITAIDIKREGMSDWRKNWEKTPSATLTPEFIDYSKAISTRPLTNGVELAVVKNPSNDLFSLSYIVAMGSNNDRLLDLAVEYLPYLGTSRLGPKEFKKELFKLGLSINVRTDEDRVVVGLTGLEKNLPQGITLLEELLSNAQPNEEALKSLVDDIAKERENAQKDKNTILQAAMYSYARYGTTSPFNDVMPLAELQTVPSKDLIDRLHGLTAHPHKVFYYGRKSADEVAILLNGLHKVPATFKPVPAARTYTEQETTANTVLFVDHDMVQTEMMWVSKADGFNAELLPQASLFNEYFGSGLSSIVFQEIREAKALAYGASASFSTPRKKEEAHFVRVFIGTQADKLNDAVDAMSVLMSDMPVNENQFNGARTAAMKRIASDRITKERIYWSYDAVQRLGRTDDIRKLSYDKLPGITVNDLKTFFDAKIKGRKYTYLVIGKKSALNMESLQKLGTVRELSKQEIFGY